MGNRVDYNERQEAFRPPVWEEPDCYDLNDSGDRRQMYGREMMQLATKHGRAEEIARELFHMRHPDRADDATGEERFVESIVKQGDRFGKWFYFPWSNSLVQYPDEEDLRALLSFRNRELITDQEQRKLGAATIAHVGLSVGLKVLEETVHMGMGRKLIIADHDTVSLTNLNRLNAGMESVGMRKTDVAGIRVSELNPYISQVHLPEGVSPDTLAVLERRRPDVIYEHVDHLPTKVLMRQTAGRLAVPLVMATDIGDRSLIDVERYDISDTEPFLGRLSPEEIAMIEKGGLNLQETMRLVVEIIGHENISVRMAQSLGRIGVTLGGIAQLGTTAAAGAAYAAVAGRDILLGRPLASGRYELSPQGTFGGPLV